MNLRITMLLIGAFAAIVSLSPSAFSQIPPLWTQPLKECWKVSLADSSTNLIASDNTETLFITKTSPSIQALSATTGGLLWTVDFGGVLGAEVRYVDEKLRFVVLVDGVKGPGKTLRIYEVDPDSGISRTIGEASLSGSPIMRFDGRRVFTLTNNGELKAFSTGGNRLWQVTLKGDDFQGLSIEGDFLAAYDSKGNVRVISTDGGVERASFLLSSAGSGAFAFSGERFYAGGTDGNVYALDLNKGEIEWRSRTGGSIDELTIVGRDVLVSSSDNFIYRLSDGNGSRSWKRKLAGRIVGKAILDRLYAGFVSLGSEEVFVIRLSDGKLVNRFQISEGGYFPSRPVNVAGLLILPLESGLIAIGPRGACEKK